MNIASKKILAFLIAAGTLSSLIAPISENANAAGMSPETYKCTSSYIPGKTSFNVAVSKSNGTYYLLDSVHNIRVVSPLSQGNSRADSITVPDKNRIASFTGTPNDITQQKLATLYNVEGVYDWFSSLGYSDFGAEGDSTLYVTMIGTTGAAFSDLGNIHIDGNVNNNSKDNLIPFAMLYFGEKPGSDGSKYHKMMSTDRDVVGHEMTHIVLKKQLDWYTDMESDETLALMEAYCDVFGELADDDNDWKIAYDSYTGSYCIRDLANPTATKTPQTNGALYKSNFYTNYELFKSDLESGDIVSGPWAPYRSTSALGSTVISHTAYLMYKYGISKNDLSHIWFDSLGYYTKSTARKATFEDCRRAVTNAAINYFKSVKYSNKKTMEKLEIINNAFDSSNIFIKNNFSYPLTYTDTRQNIVAVSTNMSNFVRAESQKYPTGKYWNGNDINTYSSTALPTSNYKQCNGITVCPTFYKGFNKSFKYAVEEPYYQCAGFAKKLQMDYYGTTKFLQLSSAKDYSPRIGDHLRVYLPGTPSDLTGHSIFITRVSGTSITYAECNANGDSKIAWNKTGTITKKTDGTLSIKLGSTNYSFAWVERPIMLGDVTGDSYVNQSDVNLIKTLVTYGKNYTSVYNGDKTYRNFVADLNKDGKITSADTNLLTNAIKSSAGMNYEFVK